MLSRNVLRMVGVALVMTLTGCVEPGADFTDGEASAEQVQSVVGGECTATSDCWEGLRCLRQEGQRFCVQTCEGNRECASGICNPVPGSRVGWCALTQEDLIAAPGQTPGGGNTGGGNTGGDGGPAPNPGDGDPDSAPAPDSETAPTPPDDGFVDEGNGDGGNDGGDGGGGDNPPQTGAEAYSSQCSGCHGGRGEGGRGPALFDWDGGLSQLRLAIDTTMPPREPEACVGECANSVARYILENFVSGDGGNDGGGNDGGGNDGGGNTNPPEPEPCVYPSGGSLAYNQTFPALSWSNAYLGDGTQTSLSMEDLYCNPEYARYKTVTFVVGTGWCGACPSYIRSIGNAASQLDAAGGLIVFVEAEDNSYQPATSAEAHQIISRYTTAGIRVGDAETSTGARTIYNSSLVSSFPSCFMVRLSDMKIIADQSRNGGWALDWVGITQEAPERGDHGGGNNGGGNNNPPNNGGGDNGGDNNPPGNNGCVEENGDSSNNNPSSAAQLNVGDSISGGVCTSGNIDAYSINSSGTWRLDLLFSHAAGDLDVYVWNTSTNQPMTQNGQRVGSETTNDNESFTFTGPATVVILGYQGATAPYTLRVTQQ